jgi:GT2 family glycosyltransferase
MISLLVVNYRSAALTVEAIRSARATSSTPLQVVIVDNSCDSAEAELLRSHADVLLVSDVNRGYAGAINDGRRACTGQVLVVTNPDVIFGAGAIDRLAEALDEFAVAGPALFWDENATWMLPPSDLHTGREVLSAGVASRSRRWRALRDRSRIRRRMGFWRLASPTPVRAISGAVMAIRALAFDAVAGFDERFPLYFEENDFVRRLQQLRERTVYVPQAHCRHVYNQSAAQVASHAAAAYAESEEKYLAKWNGPWAARVLKRLERPMPGADARPIDGPIKVDRPCDVVIEASPLASFDTAAGHFPKGSVIDVPPDVWRAFRGPALYLRVVEQATSRVVATYARYKS